VPRMAIYIQSLHLQNLLSFGPEAAPVQLGDLNVIIGPNGSGKSNLIAAISLLAAAPRILGEAIREGGGINEWIWKGDKSRRTARLDASVAAMGTIPLQYELVLKGFLSHALIEERIERSDSLLELAEPFLYFGHINGSPHIRMQNSLQPIDLKTFSVMDSVLAQRRDPIVYPEMYGLSNFFQSIHMYRNWSFGRDSMTRMPQPADLPNHSLMEDARNLGLVLNKIRRDPEAKDSLLRHLGLVYEGVRDVDVSIEGGAVQVFLQENKWTVPATRLSDGTLRWLSLLTILVSPGMQSLVCIEEPEMGLHPDLLPPLAQLLREASQRMQLIVTTHSDALVDALSDTPESVLVCEKADGSTWMRRLQKDGLSDWLEKYTLGQLWRRGELGGNRW
jgi:predicted ATPase